MSEKHPSEAVRRLVAGQPERTIAEKFADPNRPTWDQYKKDNEDKLNLEGLDQKMMEDYRRHLDAERDERLARGRNHKKRHSDESESSESRRKTHKKHKKKHKRKHKKRHYQSGTSSDSDATAEERRHRKKKQKKKRTEKEEKESEADSYRLSNFFSKDDDE